MRSEIQAVAWRSYWPVAVLAITFLAVVGLFGTYLTARQHAANDRAEKQRRAICAILANIPGHIPPEIVKARTVFARPGHRGDCQPVVRTTPTHRPTPHPTVTVTIRPAPMAAASPAPSRSSSPQPRPTHPRPSPSPTPSPSRTCILIVCT